MSRLAIEAEGLSKRYLLGEDFASYLTLREALSSALRRKKRAQRDRSELWALRDVDLRVSEGEVVGVVGRNGAGKSTLLKLVGRVTEPTAGVVRARGRVGVLLEVGTGFHPELTGRENVYLNAAILGMSRRDIARRFEEIVDFAGVGAFLDTPLKRYSSGMMLRLAFSVAAHVEPPIVVVDEVLAVGDVEFQQKCLGKMSELQQSGRTVLFVSHDLGAVRQICPRVIWIDGGRVVADGPADEVIDGYLRAGAATETAVRLEPTGKRPVELLSLEVTGGGGEPLELPRRDMPLRFVARFVTRRPVPDLDISFYLLDRKGVRVVNESWAEVDRPPGVVNESGTYVASMSLPPVLAAGDYVAGIWMGSTIGNADETFIEQELLTLRLWPRADDRYDALDRPRLVRPGVEWDVAAVRSVDPAGQH